MKIYSVLFTALLLFCFYNSRSQAQFQKQFDNLFYKGKIESEQQLLETIEKAKAILKKEFSGNDKQRHFATFYVNYLTAQNAYSLWLKDSAGQQIKNIASQTLASLNIDEPLLNEVVHPTQYFETYFNLRKALRGEESLNASEISRCEYLLYHVKNNDVKNQYISPVVHSELNRNGLNSDLENLFLDIQLGFTNNEIINDYNLLRLRYEPLRYGNLVPDCDLISRNGEKKKLSDFVDQVLVIKVWSVSDTNSFADREALTKINTNFQGDSSVRFIKIAIDAPGDKNKWQSVVKNTGDAENHFLIPDYARNTFLKNYCISTLPRYMIINRGKFFMSHATTPENPQLEVFIHIARGSDVAGNTDK